ncbi:MAG TPA: DUF6690 family protein [Pirellulales bacterium]|nr:DUF6690 family protein [Pirellulales bacterium]
MFSRSWFAMMLLGAIGLPYLFFSLFGSQKSPRTSLGGSGGAALSAAALSNGPPPPGAAALLDKAPTQNDFAEVFRWDVTTSWILARWPRVSAGLAEVEQQGYRVPLVTGTSTDDLAGSLTYYFSARQQLERITFLGTTGDGRRLVALLATKFGFVREQDDDPSLFLYRVREGRKVVSELRIKPAHIVRSDTPYSRFEVALLIKRPAGRD